MLDLDDPLWKELTGGYNTKCDASKLLKELENSNDEEEIKELFKSLWEELYHQGDVGLASYFSLPHIIRIGVEKSLNNWDVPGLVALIELARQKNNPTLPESYLESYRKEIKRIVEFIDQNQNRTWSNEFATTSLAALAIINGKFELGELILELEELKSEYISAYIQNYPEVDEWMDNQGFIEKP